MKFIVTKEFLRETVPTLIAYQDDKIILSAERFHEMLNFVRMKMSEFSHLFSQYDKLSPKYEYAVYAITSLSNEIAQKKLPIDIAEYNLEVVFQMSRFLKAARRGKSNMKDYKKYFEYRMLDMGPS